MRSRRGCVHESRAQTLTDWLTRKGFGCHALRYDAETKRYMAVVVVTKEVEVPSNVYVEPEEEDRFHANPRRHLLLPFYQESCDEDTDAGMGSAAAPILEGGAEGCVGSTGPS